MPASLAVISNSASADFLKGSYMKKLNQATGGGGQQRPPTEQKTTAPTKKKVK